MSTDGSVGAAQTLGGPNYDIDAELGTQAGGNLFHSFQEFSIGTDESATFSGPGSVDNIISRVTGGELSAVDGLLASTIPGASLWLFNPAGVVFGPNASLDVSGSFHVSTADEVRFADGGRFSAVDPAGNGFSVAAPESFGFLGSDPAGITIAGSQLAVGEGEILSVVGGDVDITGASLATAGGSLNVLAADGAADANVVTGDLTGDADGAIAVSGSALASVGDGGGAVRIEGSAFVVDGGSSIISTNTGATDGDIGVGIDVETAEIIGASAIRTNALAAGDGGSIDLRADRIRVADSSFVTSLSTSSGDGGDINVSGERITFESTGVAISSAQADGEGGAISVAADDLRLTGSSIATTTQAASSGQGGDVVIVVGSVDILAGGADGRSIISTASFGQGQAGDIDIRAGSVLADAENRVTGAAIQSVSGGASNLGGQIRLNVDDLTLVRGGLIATDPGQNAGGLNSIDIAADTISIDGAGDLLTGISLTVDAGNTAPGTIAIRAGDIDLQNGGVILSATASDANASNILIVADRLSLGGGAANRRTQINSNAANGSTGAAGRVTIIADDIDLSSTALISSSTRGAGSGGVVDITANGRLALRDQSDIESNTSEDATGDAGLVSINTANLILLGEGSISSRTEGVGDAGSIDISARTALLDNENTLGFGGITTQGAPGSSGDAGNITLLFDDLIIRNSSQVSSNVFGTGNAGAISVASKTITIDALQPNQNALTGFSSSAGLQGIGDGDAGAITVTADRLTARGNTAQITSSNDGAGSAGTIDLRLTDGLILDEGADVFTESVSAGGGGITIAADNYVVANGSDSVITTTVADDAGNAGDIVIATPLLALGDSRVLARADAGRGGDIQISVEDLILSPVSDINAEAGATGIDGTVVVTAAEVDLTSGLAALDGRFLDVSSLLRERCAARRGEITSSFTFGGGGAILPDLDSPRLSFLEAKPTRGSAGRLDRQTILALPCPSAAS
ncbi:MAG: filamentous hemagglutinin N-terminal domain-containing protein [Geminicoccaceae bacterium]